MGTIQTGVGLASGLDINTIVTALINAQKGPINVMQNRIKVLQGQQAALGSISANLLTLSTSADTFSTASTFTQSTINNSDTSQFNVTTTSGQTAPQGTYEFQALRKASTQQMVSKGFANSTTQTVGAGTITIASGGGVASQTRLDMLNGGAGVPNGQFRVTDRSGATAVIDTTGDVTVDDVVNQINTNSSIQVHASVQGNKLVLSDLTGQTTSNLSVTDLNGGQSAAGLGIVGSTASNTLAGTNVYQVTGDFKLAQIDDGNALKITNSAAPDMEITLTDPASTKVDVSLNGAVTLNDVVNKINTATGNDGKVTAAIQNGKLVLTDNTGGGGPASLSVADINQSSVVKQLGLNTTASGNTLTGNILGASMDSVLLRNLNGGQGITQLGTISLTDRSGTTANVDLSGATSLNDVLTAINNATSSGGTKLQITAAVNSAGNGIALTDSSGSAASNLIVSDVGGSTAATQLGIAVNAAQNSVNSGSLNLQYVNEGTTLSTYAGKSVDQHAFSITDSNGGEAIINVDSSVKTIGDLMQRINSQSSAKVTAQLNSTGDGVELIDQAGGTQTLSVHEVGGTTAADLHLLGAATTGGDGKQAISARSATVISVTAGDTLSTIAQKINQATGAGVTATTFDTGASLNSSHLSLQAKNSGYAGSMIIDDGGLLGTTTTSQGQDAVMQVGGPSGYTLTSSTNTFTNAVSGLTVQMLTIGTTPAEVQVTPDTSAITNAVTSFVSSYNAYINNVSNQTKFDTTTNTGGPLQGDASTLNSLYQMQSLVNNLYGSSSSPVRSLLDLGVSVNSDGTLALDNSVLANQLQTNPQAVSDFFSTKTTGFGTVLTNAINSMTDTTTGSLALESTSDQSTIDSLNSQISDMNTLLNSRQTDLFNEFYNMETTLSQLQSQQRILNQFQGILPTSSSSSSSSGSNSSSSTG